ncbi:MULTISPECIES: acyl-CoA dehydrogenase family protein [Protofrankia]|uniref:Medium-chain specific acyl-CoA dehydrogenase, mitochondrial n=1 Tax=Protofrankia coriariae TaxID=1562887 RepID=A0ABR5F5Z7_9ACTN|nr:MULTISPECIES: acyl-CoA dehydrogenase family protein [Protofrankia]KLL12156.1 acyl-CoA dehydrogenase [Protofrankia coriariae]ONH37049.1 acyl-CoA dehydrogenase [Protofrankia sp. BMG5.30]
MSTLDPRLLALPFYERPHRELAEALGRFCDTHAELVAAARTGAPEKYTARVLRALGDAGLLTPTDLRGLCLTREALAYTEDLLDFAFSIQALATWPIQRHGTDEQKRRWLPGMARGELAGAFALSEEQAGSDVAALALRAVPDGHGTGYVLDGHKTWIAGAAGADVFCVVARTGDGPAALGLTALLVPAGTPGLRIEPIDMLAERDIARLEFDGCRVAADAVLGGRGGGFVVAMELLERFRLTVGAAALGFARRAADAALARARGRAAYGGRLFDLPTVKASLADVEVRLNATALLVARAAWEADRGTPPTEPASLAKRSSFAKHSSIAKLYATEAAQQVVDAAVQVFGAAGLVRDSLPERLYRQIRSLRIYEGASEVQRLAIADALPPAASHVSRTDAGRPPKTLKASSSHEE